MPPVGPPFPPIPARTEIKTALGRRTVPCGTDEVSGIESSTIHEASFGLELELPGIRMFPTNGTLPDYGDLAGQSFGRKNFTTADSHSLPAIRLVAETSGTKPTATLEVVTAPGDAADQMSHLLQVKELLDQLPINRSVVPARDLRGWNFSPGMVLMRRRTELKTTIQYTLELPAARLMDYAKQHLPPIHRQLLDLCMGATRDLFPSLPKGEQGKLWNTLCLFVWQTTLHAADAMKGLDNPLIKGLSRHAGKAAFPINPRINFAQMIPDGLKGRDRQWLRDQLAHEGDEFYCRAARTVTGILRSWFAMQPDGMVAELQQELEAKMDKIVDRILNSNANLEHPLPGIADKAALFMGKMVPPARYSKTNSSGQTVRPVSIAVERRDTREQRRVDDDAHEHHAPAEVAVVPERAEEDEHHRGDD